MKNIILFIIFFLFNTSLYALETEAVSIQLKWKHGFQFAGYYAAIEKGFYADEGLNVTLKDMKIKHTPVQNVLDKYSEYGVGDSSLVLYHQKKSPIVLIAQIFQYSPLVLISHRDSNITTPDHLIGKTINYSLHQNGGASLNAMILKTIGSFEKIKVSQFTNYTDFINKKIDVISAYSTSQPYWLKKQGIDLNIIDPKSYGIDFYGDNFYTTQQELQNHPDRVEKMKRATLKGWKYALSHKQEIIDIILKKYAPKLTKDFLSYEAHASYQMIMPDLIPLGKINKQKYERVAKIYQQLGMVKNEKIKDTFFYDQQQLPTYLNKTEQQWITNNPIVKVGVEPDWAPFYFINPQGIHDGIANDYLNLISKKIGLKFDLKVANWSDNLQKIKEKKIDLIPTIYYSKEREEYIHYTKPYFEMLDYFFIRDDLNITTLKDMNGKRIAIPKGYIYEKIIKKEFPHIKIVPVDSFSQAIEAVLENHADILLDTYATLSYVLKKGSISTIIPFKAYRGTQVIKLHMGTHIGTPILASILDKGLSRITHKEKEMIYNKWISIDKKEIPLTNAEKKWLSENPIATFAGNPNRLPYIAINKQKKYIGIVPDYLDEMQKLIPITFQPKIVHSHQELKVLLEKNSIDLIPGDRNSPIFALNYRPITSEITAPIVILMKDKHTFIDKLENIKNLKIASLDKYGYSHKLYKRYPNIPFIKVKNAQQAIQDLSIGRYDALLLAMPTAGYLIKTNNYNNINIVGKTDVLLNLTLFVHKDKPILYQIMNKTRAAISPTKDLDIIGKWQDIKFAKKIDYALLYQVIGFFLFFLAASFYWNSKLRREIKERQHFETALQIEKKNFETLFEKSSDGNLIIQDGKFILANSSALHTLGLSDISELLNTTPAQWSPSHQNDSLESVKKAEKMIDQCFQRGHNRFEWIHKDKNENEFWIDVVLTKIIYEEKHAVYVTWRDINEQKNLENSLKEREAHLRILIDNLPVEVIVSTLDGSILTANSKVLYDYKMTEQALTAYNINDFYDDSKDRIMIIKELQDRGKVEGKIVKVKQPDNTICPMLVSIIPIIYEEKNAMLTIALDMTERLKMEKALERAKEEAEYANHAKSEFLASMSHEIRTPMNSVIGFSQLLSRQIKDPIQQEYLDSIIRGGHSLLDIINDILDLSKIEAGKLEIIYESVDIKKLVLEIESTFQMKLIQKNLHYELSIDPSLPQYLLLDSTRIRQVLFNLLDNAIKFTNRGYIKLSVKQSKENEEKSKIDLQFCVEDSGIGIKEKQLKNIFNSFEQQKGQDNQKYGGTGLGLSICKKLTTIMNGTISVESKVDIGSKFTVTLAEVAISAVEARTKQVINMFENIQFEKATVMVVDDIKDNRKLVASTLNEHGLEVIEAIHGKDAIEQLKNIKVDLIFMDIKMPILDGYQAVKIIKNDTKLKTIPIIALTASVIGKDSKKIKDYQFDGYLRKPVTYDQLLTEIGRFINYETNKTPLKIEQNINENNLDNIPKVVDMLEQEYKQTWKRIKDRGDFSLIKNFSQSLEELAQKHDINLLSIYAKELKTNCESYNIESVDFIMNSYIPFIKKLKGLLK